MTAATSLDALLAKDAIIDVLARYSRTLDWLDDEGQATCYWPEAAIDYGFFTGTAADFVPVVMAVERQSARRWHMLNAPAIRLIGALETAGVSVPAEVSVIGFDDLPYAAMMKPPLSTLAVDNIMIGRQAIALLLRRLAEPSAPAMQVECGVRMEFGGTVAQITQNLDPA